MSLNDIFAENNVRYLYKYLPYSEGSLEVLKSGTIKYTHPLDFNDPFDCSPVYDQEAIDQLPNTRPDLFDVCATIENWDPSDYKNKVKEKLPILKEKFLNGEIDKEIFQNTGIVSLSKNPYNILMWSHYAQDHKGFVVGFRIPINATKSDLPKIDFLCRLLEVNYSKERLKYAYGIDSDEVMLKKTILTKSIDWKYEEEERVIDPYREPGIHKYPRNDMLACVIAGVRMQKEHKNNIRKILNEIQPELRNKVKLFEAQESKEDYKIIIPSFNFPVTADTKSQQPEPTSQKYENDLSPA
jgi:hypothetical protein